MTSDRDDEAERRARLAAILMNPTSRPESEATTANRRTWSRASEQERRRMLKDCGWL